MTRDDTLILAISIIFGVVFGQALAVAFLGTMVSVPFLVFLIMLIVGFSYISFALATE